MRVSTRQQYDTYQRQIQESQMRYFDAHRKVTSGKRIDRLGDDPTGAGLVLSVKSLRAGVQQYDANLRAAKDYLGFSEQALGETNEILTKAYELAVRGANSSPDQSARDAMAREVGELKDRLLTLANATGGSGQHLFAGHVTDAKPFAVAGSSLVFGGDLGSVNVEIAPGSHMRVNTDAEQLFKDAFDRLSHLQNSLFSGAIGDLSGVDIPQLQASQRAVGDARGEIGAKLQSVEQQTDMNKRRIDDLTATASEIEDVDFAEALLEMQAAQTAYEAALRVGAQGFKLTLMDYI